MHVNTILNKIREASLQDKLVIFIGAGVSKNSGFKLWQEVVKDMDRYLGYTPKDEIEDKKYSTDELLKIPQFLYGKNIKEYKDIIISEYGKEINSTNTIVDTLLQLKPKHIITTNFDQLIEKSLSVSQLIANSINGDTDRYTRIVKDADMINAKRNNFFIKMHGDTENLEHLVLKEIDYLNYTNTHSFIETFIKTLFINHTFLFVGYSVNDYNLKLIMSWVDNIANNNIKPTQRTQHFFINANKSLLNKYEKKYLRAHNINVLEYKNLPQEFTSQDISIFEDYRGNNLQKCCLFLLKQEPTAYEINEIIELLKVYDNKNFVCFKDILHLFNMDNHPLYSKIGNTLYIDIIDGLNENNPIFKMYKILEDVKSENIEIKKKIEVLLLKCRINRIEIVRRYQNHDKKVEILGEYKSDFSILDSFICNDIEGLRKLLNDNADISKLDKAYILSFFRDKECITMYKEIYQSAIIDRDFYKQLLLGVNIFHSEGNVLSSVNLRDVLPNDYLKSCGILVDYIDGYKKSYSVANSICDKIVKKYSPYAYNMSEVFPNREFDTFRNEVYDTILYFINDCIDVGSRVFSHSIWGNFENYIKVYITTICKLVSPYAQRKLATSRKNKMPYHEYKLELLDLYILINLISVKELKFLLNDCTLQTLKSYDDNRSIDFLLLNLNNLSVEFDYVIENKNNPFYTNDLIDKIIKCMLIIQRFSLDESQIQYLLSILERILILGIPLYKGDFPIVYKPMIKAILEILLNKNAKNKKSNAITSTVQRIFSNLVEEIDLVVANQNIHYVKFLDESGILISFNQLIEPKELFDDKKIEKLTETFLENYPQEMYKFFSAIYKFSSENYKERFKEIIIRNQNNLTSHDIYILIALKILKFTEISSRIIDLCECEKEFYKIDDDGDISRSLHMVARLHELGFICDLGVFTKYAQYNHFFSFVCFPDQFDYNNFNVNWYSWLSLEKYSKYIVGETMQILKPLFDTEMSNNPSDKFKAIYYRLFFDLTDRFSELND